MVASVCRILFFAILILGFHPNTTWAQDYANVLPPLKNGLSIVNQRNQAREQTCSKQSVSAKTNLVCPRFIFDFFKDSRQSGAAGIVPPIVEQCYSKYDASERNLKYPSAVNQPKWLHQALKSTNLSRLGEVAESVGKACSETSNSKPEDYSRLYFALAKLNEAAKKSAVENVRIHRLLEEPVDSVLCPNKHALPEAAEVCEKEKTCESSQYLARIANSTLVDLEKFKKAKKNLETVSASCSKSEIKGSSSNCQEDREKLSALVSALILKNPWFLDNDFLTGDGLAPGYRLKRYLQKRKTHLVKYQADLEQSSKCLLFENASNCDVRTLREILEMTPDVKITGRDEVVNKKFENLFAFQACQDEASLERDRLADKVNAPFQALLGAGVQMNVEHTLEKVALGRFSAIPSAAKILIPRISGLFSSESALHLMTGSSALLNIKKSCVDRRIEVTRNSNSEPNQKQCSATNQLFGSDQFDETSCMVDLASAAVAVSPALGADLIAKKIATSVRPASNTASLAQAKLERANTNSSNSLDSSSLNGRSAEANLQKRAGFSPERRAVASGSGASEGNIYLTRSGVESYTFKKSPAIVNKPPQIEVVEVSKVDGRKSFMYTAIDKLKDGTWVRTANEFLFDKATGAIDATSPAGKDLFQRLAAAVSGEAHFAFFDVGRLGFVNNNFQRGLKDGDDYLKGVADMILKHGKGKVTLARTGGDEFGLIVHEADPAKAKKILEDIRNAIRDDKDSLAKQVFVNEKTARAEEFKQAVALFKRNNPEISAEELRDLMKFDSATLQAGGLSELSGPRLRIEDLARTSTPNVSVGATAIGRFDDLPTLNLRSEDIAKSGKIELADQSGLPTAKYGVDRPIRQRPNPNFRPEIELPSPSPSWGEAPSVTPPSTLGGLRAMRYTRGPEIMRVGDTTISEYTDELGRLSYRSERYVIDPKTQQKVAVLTDVPTKGSSGILDGNHPESGYIISSYFEQAAEQILVQPKVKSLRYLNYFGDGMKAGDEVLAVVAELLKKNSRPQDLNFKMNGADYLWGGNGVTLDVVKERMSTIKKQLREHPRIKKLIQDEVDDLNRQIQNLQKMGKAKEASEKMVRLKQIENFDFDLQFETLTYGEFTKPPTVQDIQLAFDAKFKK